MNKERMPAADGSMGQASVVELTPRLWRDDSWLRPLPVAVPGGDDGPKASTS